MTFSPLGSVISEPINKEMMVDARKKGDVAEAVIESLNFDGRGVARIDGKATFIEGALPGERVRFRYHNKYSSYDTGLVQEIVHPSSDRVTPSCQYFGVCGGCLLQHMTPLAQLLAKQKVLADNLKHIGRVQPDTWLVPLSGKEWGYRRRARLGARLVSKKGGVLVGFRERRRSYITRLDACLTLDVRVSNLLPQLHNLIAGLSRPDRLPQIEVAAGDNAVALVFRHVETLTEEDICRFERFSAEHKVQIYLQPDGRDSIHPVGSQPTMPLFYRLPEYDVQLEFEPTDFIQINAEVNRKLVNQALALLDVQPHERVLDLFCGLGNFTLPLARAASFVVGVESDAGLLDRARHNLNINGLSHVEFLQADLYKEPLAMPFIFSEVDKLLLDPPRAGAIEVIKNLPRPGPQRIVYVSCYPATLARDSDYLVHNMGYRLQSCGVADMFPHTSHVESIALYVRD